ncbi:MAG: hypothetical protein ACI97A_003820 [Planctomycetota bacterium]|jgi:hypothetical protein
MTSPEDNNAKQTAEDEASFRTRALLGGFLWGLAEGKFFFIVPDVFLGFMAMRSVRAAAWAWAASIAGSLVAIIVIHLCMDWLGLNYIEFITHLPGISESLLASVHETISSQGLPYTSLLVLTGIPLKVLGASAFGLGQTLGSVLLWTVFARVVRIAPAFVVFGGLSHLFRAKIEAQPRCWFIGVSIVWVLFYVFYFAPMD